ncbi:MAG: tetratricopeptide repeat protein [Cellvibrionaceae bacterium]
MRFIKHSVCLLVCLLVVGCASNTQQQKVSVNPYLEGRAALPNDVKLVFFEAAAAMDAKQWGKAESLLNPLWQENRHLSGIAVNLGLISQAKKDLPGAASWFEKAIKANKNNLNAYNYLAVLHRQQGDFAQAEAQYQQALDIWDRHPQSHYNLAVLYELYMGKLPEALDHYRRYRELLEEPNRRVDGWIKDLERRIAEGVGAAQEQGQEEGQGAGSRSKVTNTEGASS